MIRRTSARLQQAARDLRREATRAEELLWEALRARRLDGLRFRRQHAVGRFVLDFYCPAARLAVEVDGESHEHRGERDEERTAVLSAGGLLVLRFENLEVLNDLPRVLGEIARVARMRAEPLPPLPALGEGARG